jgi:hypothetical protein
MPSPAVSARCGGKLWKEKNDHEERGKGEAEEGMFSELGRESQRNKNEEKNAMSRV